MLRLITHGTLFVIGAVLADSVRPLLRRAALALRPVAKDAVREGILAGRAVRQLGAEVSAELDAAQPRALEPVKSFPRLNGDA